MGLAFWRIICENLWLNLSSFKLSSGSNLCSSAISDLSSRSSLLDQSPALVQTWRVRILPKIGSKLQPWCCVILLAISGAHVLAQSRSNGATDIAKYAINLPEKSILKIDPNIVKNSVSGRYQSLGTSDGTGSAVSQRNSMVAGSGDYAWKVAISTTVFWVGEQATEKVADC